MKTAIRRFSRSGTQREQANKDPTEKSTPTLDPPGKHTIPRSSSQILKPSLCPRNRCLVMRSIGVGTQGLCLSFPARLLGSGAKRSAKPEAGATVKVVQKQKPWGGQVLEFQASSPSR